MYLPETATLVYTTIAPMMPGLVNHLVEMHRDLRCAHRHSCSLCALPMRCLCWPYAGACRGEAIAGVLAMWPHVCLETMGCQQLGFAGLAVSAFGAAAAAAGRHHQQCQLLPHRCHRWLHTPNADSAGACLWPYWLHTARPLPPHPHTRQDLACVSVAVPRHVQYRVWLGLGLLLHHALQQVLPGCLAGRLRGQAGFNSTTVYQCPPPRG